MTKIFRKLNIDKCSLPFRVFPSKGKVRGDEASKSLKYRACFY